MEARIKVLKIKLVREMKRYDLQRWREAKVSRK